MSANDDRPTRSHHPVFAELRATQSEPEPESLQDRRDAVTALGRAVHELVQATVATEAETEVLRRIAALAREAAAALAQETRPRERFSRVDDLRNGIRMYNPVTGSGSPFAPPLRIAVVDGRVEATCTLGLAYEGPPMFVHGGVSAMLLDQILGYAVSLAGRPGMTRDLACRYRRPVPLETPLYLTAQVDPGEPGGRHVLGTATLATADDPSTVLVEANATFVSLRRDQAREIFAAAFRADPAG